ncbi:MULTISPECIES: hypothetical protein [unclassified Sphingobium]|uniref:hypothetical protein n=1 Tax=unclassified Sphingobium TaxID=2611147 RepID=UPI0022250DEB|nr:MULTISPECIES: hypothetical protein [unclassified Sphingobium]MCW2394165.1 hypothetical protein [Sphingobium sp. B8D3B]MCW2417679.1 hypothetical protein [Sphingobium sp. B8D3C]
MAGGAGSFRPARPDALLSGIYASDWQKAHCYLGVKVNAAFKLWGERLAMHVPGGCDLTKALAGKYDELDQRALDQVMEAWLDMASVAGEYDPYPLGTARLSVPRLADNGSGKTSLFFYMQRAGGAEVREFYWAARVPGQVQVTCDAAQCGGGKRVMPISTGWEGIPSAPWVAKPSGRGVGLLWWRRRFTNQSTTGGNVGRLWQVAPQDRKERLAWRFNLAPEWEPNAPNPYFVTGLGGDERLAAFYYDRCPRENPRRLVLRQLRVRSAQSIQPGKTDFSDPRSIDDLGGGPLLSALAIPPLILRDKDGVSVTIFRREGEAGGFRKSIGAQTWRVPDAAPRRGTAAKTPSPTAQSQTNTDDCPTKEALLHGRPAEPTTSTYALTEEQEPFAPLPQGLKPPLLLAIRCQHPGEPGWFDWLEIGLRFKAPERCAAKQTLTELSLLTAGTKSGQLLRLEGRYVSRVPIFRIASTGDYAAVFVRFVLRKARQGVRLEALSRIVMIHGQKLTKGDEIRLGVVSPPDETMASSALARSSRLVPLVGDTDGDGWLDLVIADPDNGATALSYPSGYVHRQLAFGTQPIVRRYPLHADGGFSISRRSDLDRG